MKTKLIAFLAGLCLLSVFAAGGASAKATAGPTTVGTDPVGDWGANVDGSLAALGDPLAQDLTSAAIGLKDAKTLNFIFKVTNLPSNGGVPEVSRYDWDFKVDGNAFQLTGAWTDYIRGVCSPLVTNYCPPPHDPGMQPFFVRQGPCTVGADCFLLATVQATFDPSAKTITVPVPLSVLKARPGSRIGPGTTTLGGSVFAAPAALITEGDVPNDTLTVTSTYVVPRVK